MDVDIAGADRADVEIDVVVELDEVGIVADVVFDPRVDVAVVVRTRLNKGAEAEMDQSSALRLAVVAALKEQNPLF